MDLHLAACCPYLLPLKRSALPLAPRLGPAERLLLAQDQRRRGEHRPRRLTLGRWDHFPFVFHAAQLPGPGLHLPSWPELQLVFWLHLYDPMPWPPIVYLRCARPKPHPDQAGALGVRQSMDPGPYRGTPTPSGGGTRPR